jgi:hypothetical protein
MYVTLDVGPRVIRLGLVGGPNELVEMPGAEGEIGTIGFRLHGGHRLWIAPEVEARTMQPDNDPVAYGTDGDWHVFSGRTDKWNVQKEIRIKVEGDGGFSLDHRIYNHSPYTIDLAAWALTMFAPGGTCYFPMPVFKAHTERVLPDRPIVLWGYTNLADPRWTWGKTMSAFRQDSKLGPQKIGSFVRQGYAAYANHGNLFVKTFGADDELTYPDMGCNFETFSNQAFLECESLGPMTMLAPGGCLKHFEGWRLVGGASVPADPDEAFAVIEKEAKRAPRV